MSPEFAFSISNSPRGPVGATDYDGDGPAPAPDDPRKRNPYRESFLDLSDSDDTEDGLGLTMTPSEDEIVALRKRIDIVEIDFDILKARIDDLKNELLAIKTREVKERDSICGRFRNVDDRVALLKDRINTNRRHAGALVLSLNWMKAAIANLRHRDGVISEKRAEGLGNIGERVERVKHLFGSTRTNNRAVCL